MSERDRAHRVATASGVAAKQERAWVYMTTAAVAAGTTVRIAVTAEDRPVRLQQLTSVPRK
jgi:hypothetical protein